MSQEISLDAATIDSIVEKLAARLRAAPITEVNSWLNREEAASHLTISPRSFDRLRELHPEALKASSDKPLRWDRSALDVFKLTRGVVLPARRGRKRSVTV